MSSNGGSVTWDEVKNSLSLAKKFYTGAYSEITAEELGQTWSFLTGFAAIISNNTKDRFYVAYAPCASTYTFKFRLKGDGLISVRNIVEIWDSSNARIYARDLEWSSDGDHWVTVSCAPGPIKIHVGLGSGSVASHTAGTADDAYLDSPTPVSWNVEGGVIANWVVPVEGMAFGSNSASYVCNSNYFIPYGQIEGLPALVDRSSVTTSYRYESGDYGLPDPMSELDAIRRWGLENTLMVYLNPMGGAVRRSLSINVDARCFNSTMGSCEYDPASDRILLQADRHPDEHFQFQGRRTIYTKTDIR